MAIAELITSQGCGGFAELENTDQRVDALHAGLLAWITGEAWTHGVVVAAQLALLGRFYERFGDQAVSVAKRLEFAATGALPG